MEDIYTAYLKDHRNEQSRELSQEFIQRWRDLFRLEGFFVINKGTADQLDIRIRRKQYLRAKYLHPKLDIN